MPMFTKVATKLHLCTSKAPAASKHFARLLCGINVVQPACHEATCSLLYQCALTHLHLLGRSVEHEHDGPAVPRAKGNLRICFTCAAAVGSGQVDSEGEKTSASRERWRTRRGQGEGSARRHSLAGGDGQHLGEASPATRGCDQQSKVRPRTSLLPAQHKGQHPSGPIQSLAECQRSQTAEHPVPKPLRNLLLQALFLESRMDTDSKILEKTKNALLVNKHGWSYQKWCPQLHKLVADTAKTEIPLQVMCQHLSEMCKLMDGGDSSQVCGQQSYDNHDVGAHRKVDSLPAGSVYQGRRSIQTLRAPQSSRWQLNMAGGRCSDEARHSAQTGLGETSSRMALNPPAQNRRGEGTQCVNPPAVSGDGVSVSPLRCGFRMGLQSVIFENIHNLCYMNACISAILALFDVARIPLPRVLRDIPLCTRVNLAQALGLHLTGWRRPREQHDTAESCVFLINRTSISRHFAARQGTIQEGKRVHARLRP